MSSQVEKTGVLPGDFPFPITTGRQESRYLTWIRNHSNYMAVRGPVDYLRAVGILVRGAIINFLIGLPYLLLAAVLVAALNLLPDTPGFYVTPVVLALALGWVLLFPLVTLLFRITRHRRSLATGTDSSVKLRDRYERSFGTVLAALVGAAAFEALPYFLDRFHFWAHERGIGWPDLAAALAAATVAYSVSDKVLSLLGGVARKVALVAIGAIGLVVPLLVVLFVADFLVFADLANWDVTLPLLLAIAALPLGILVGLALGVLSRAFAGRDLVKVCLLLLGSLALLLVFLWGAGAAQEKKAEVEAELALAVEGLWAPGEQSKAFNKLTRDVAERPGPAVRKLVQVIEEVRVLAEGDPAPPVAAAPDAGLRDHLEGLLAVTRTVYLPGAYKLVDEIRAGAEAIEPAAEGELAGEVGHLLDRAALLPPLLADQPPADLVAHVLWIPDAQVADLETGGESPKLQGFAALGDAEDDLRYWGSLLREVRREVTVRGVYSPTLYPEIYRTEAAKKVRMAAFWPKVIFVSMLAVLVWLFCWLAVDVNLTSIHGLYRDRLASAFLIGADTRGDVDVEEDLDLGELCCHEAGSTAPYHLVNVALNLQGSRDIGVRDRRSDFFVFSKRFIGGERTGYCSSETMERAFPQMSLSTAMAISAAAAAPNMGRATSPALVAVMTLLNVRLGSWIPNPGLVEEKVGGKARPKGEAGGAPGYSFREVFHEELKEIERRWEQLPGGTARRLATGDSPTVAHGLVGIGFSGGGIRSATLNLGIAQALHRRGVFDHLDYMSTVSGGGYLGSSISSLMRRRTRTVSEIAGRVSLATGEAGEKVVTVSPEEPGGLARVLTWARRSGPSGGAGEAVQPREYRYASHARLAVENGQRVAPGQRLIALAEPQTGGRSTFGDRFRWRVRPGALLLEATGRLDETHRWVNVSDGGHIENLAGIELLRRHCRYVILGDGEADPEHRFNGLATLIRSARIDLGIHVDIDVDALRLDERRLSARHWAVGRIHYPGESEPGHLLYFKSSVTGDEDEVIREYRHGQPAFPHESTADQFFDEGQFEAYRSLGQHIGEEALEHLPRAGDPGDGAPTPFSALEPWFERLGEAAAALRGAPAPTGDGATGAHRPGSRGTAPRTPAAAS